jgi:Ala-tRNA(Pro) deacylase
MTVPQQLAPDMPASRQDLFNRLSELGIATRTVEHEPLFTVAESSQLERELPARIPRTCFSRTRTASCFSSWPKARRAST